MWSATWHNFNVILLNCGMNIQIRKIQDKSSYWHKNNNTSSILFKAIMSSQNNMAKESSSLQNHIVWSCSIFVTQECSHLAQPRWQAKQLFHTLVISNFFSTFTQCISVSHGHSTMGGIEYNDWGCVRRQKGESLTLTRLINRLGRFSSIDVNARSMDCHATDALEL